MSTFAVLASEDFESKQARSRAVTATTVRAQEMFDSYLSKAVSAEDKADRILLIEDDLKRVAYAVSKEYGYEDYRHLYAAARQVLAEDKTDDEDKCDKCGASLSDGEGYDGLCGNCADKAEDEGKWEKPWEKDSAKTANQWIKKRGDKFVIIQKGTGKVLSTHDSEEQAQDSFEAMEAHKHAAGPAPDAGDSYDWKREDLPSNSDTGLGGPSPKIDKGSAGDVAGTSQKPIDVGSKRHQHELQNATDRADYNNEDFDPSSPVRTRVDADKPMQPEFTKAPATDTWHGDQGDSAGQANPVTSAAAAKYQLVALA